MNQPATENGGGLIRLRLGIAYDGLHFHGWARQAGLRTVQGEIERVLGHLLSPNLEVQCAGRTDAGVHARGQVAHVDVPTQIDIPDARRINRALADDVRVTSIERAPDGFDARFSAIWRRYSYRVSDGPSGPDPLTRNISLPHPRKLDLDAMNEAAQAMLGEHDFAAFCKPREFATTIRKLLELRWEREGDLAVMHIKADAFCHSMVRFIVGAMIPVGDRRMPPDWPGQVLAGQQRDPRSAVMPAFPLVLEEVGYPASEDALKERQRQTRTLRTFEE